MSAIGQQYIFMYALKLSAVSILLVTLTFCAAKAETIQADCAYLYIYTAADTPVLTKSPPDTAKRHFSLLSIFRKHVKTPGLKPPLPSVNTYENKAHSLLPKIKLDSSFSISKYIKFHGTAGLTAYYSTYTYTGQATPQNYLRWQFNPQLEILGIPFQGGISLSTAQQYLPHANMFSFGFNAQQFQQILRDKEKAYQKQSYDFVQKKKDEEMANLTKEYEQLERQLHDPKYLDELKKQKDMLEKESKLDSFGKLQNAYSLSQAQSYIKGYEDKLKRYDSIQPLYEQYKEDNIKARLRSMSDAEKNRLDERNLAKYAQLPDKYQPYLRFLYSIRSFGIGTCYPIYSALTLNGTSVQGIDMAFNPGRLFLHFTGGKVISGTNYDPTSNTYQSASRRLYAAAMGYGKAETALVTATALYGQDMNVLPNGSDPLLRYRNAVLSVQSVLNFRDRISFSGELAKSYLAPVSNTDAGSAAGTLSNAYGSNSTGATAYSFKAKITLPITNTRLSGAVTNTGPNYTSYGMTFLRKDLSQYSGKAEQDFFRKKISVSAFMKQEEDNSLNLKQYQTLSTYYGLTAAVRLKKLPVLMFSWSPSYQKRVSSMGGKDSLLFGNNLMNASLTYTYKLKLLLFSTAAVFTQSTVRSAFASYLSQVFTLNQLINIAQYCNFNMTAMYVPASAYSQQMQSAELSLDKTSKKTINLKGGYSLRKQGILARQEGLFGILTAPLWKYGSMQLRVDGFTASNTFTPEQSNSRYYYSTQCSILVHW